MDASFPVITRAFSKTFLDLARRVHYTSLFLRNSGVITCSDPMCGSLIDWCHGSWVRWQFRACVFGFNLVWVRCICQCWGMYFQGLHSLKSLWKWMGPWMTSPLQGDVQNSASVRILKECKPLAASRVHTGHQDQTQRGDTEFDHRVGCHRVVWWNTTD